MANIHTPERLEGESFAAYKERRARSHRAVRRALAGTLVNPRKLGKGPSSTDSERARAKAKRPAPTQPKFAKQRKRVQHQHSLTDAHGAYTLTGPVYEVYGVNPDEGREHVIGAGQESDGTVFYSARRKWLGGISAQRGF